MLNNNCSFSGEGEILDLEKNFKKQFENLDEKALEVYELYYFCYLKKLTINTPVQLYIISYHFCIRKVTIQHSVDFPLEEEQ